MFQEIPPEELAFRDADEMTWRGQKLEPYSYLRKTAVVSLVNYFGGNMPEPVLAIWLGLQSDARARLARRAPDAVEADIDAWADEQKVLVLRQNSEGQMALLPDEETQSVYDRIMAGIMASTPKPSEESQKKSVTAQEIAQTT
jgi:hypothetical protein